MRRDALELEIKLMELEIKTVQSLQAHDAGQQTVSE